MSNTPNPPVAPHRPTKLSRHGDDRLDEWYWLGNKDDSEVITHLEAENAYTSTILAHTQQLQQSLYDEMLARIKQDDESVPARRGDRWSYFTRTIAGEQYEQHVRVDTEGNEHVWFDENIFAAGHDYFEVANLAISPTQNLVMYGTDTDGSERFALRVRNLVTNEDLDDEIADVHYGVAWSEDEQHLFYTRLDESMRPFQIWRHEVGNPCETDVLVIQEDDDAFFVGVGVGRTREYIEIGIYSKTSSEVLVIPSGSPLADPILIAARRPEIEYSIEHHRSDVAGSRFFIITNEDAPNFRMMVVDAANPGIENWTEVIPTRADVRLDDVDAFANHLVISERYNGLERIVIRRLSDDDVSDDDTWELEQSEEVYSVFSGTNFNFDTNVFRYGYTSMTTPRTVFDYDMNTKERTLLKTQAVLGDFDPARYLTVREWATASDGTKIPMSIVRAKHVALDGKAPALLYGYGSYEHSIDPTFSSIRLSLLDRGFVFAVAHVRGGGEMGREWYERGKFNEKRNTFTDFVACAEHLISHRYSSPKRLIARGGSAGGLLIGAVVNLRPDLFRAIVAEVPFVDTLTTMLDESLPLTTYEYEEWGNPNDALVYDYMKSYAPYDNVTQQPYPRMFVTAGLNDPRVGYWEPAKWVQRLRANTTSAEPILLRTEMGAGHGGPSGRYDALHDEAMVIAFMLDALNLA